MIHVVAIDYGLKRNILRELASVGCKLTVVPATASAEEILERKPDGVFLSNGPGDPAATGVYAVPEIKKLVDSGLPLFGICLGHQMLALAVGGRTAKMFQGHRGANHPVKRLADEQVEITSMLMLLFAGTQVERVIGGSGLVIAYVVGGLVAALAQFLVDPASAVPMVGASGAISALFGLYAIFFGAPKQVTRSQKLNRYIHVAWLLVTWVVLQWMAGILAGGEGVMLATPAHIGGFLAGLILQRPLLLWRYRKA